MRLKELMENRENPVGHCENLRLWPREYSGYRSILKQDEMERLPNFRRLSCIIENALNRESNRDT